MVRGEPGVPQTIGQGQTRNAPRAMRSRVRVAWLLRWGTMLACSGARSFALSLLERRGGLGEDSATPASHEVEWEARYA